MSEKIETLQDLAEGVANKQVSNPIIYERKVDSKGRAYATGKRKTSIAKVWLQSGSGKITINKQDINDYLVRPVLSMIVKQPLVLLNEENHYDINISVYGGGLSGQAGAIKHGISKAILAFAPEHRAALKQGGFLTRDSRMVERKKYGYAKARKSYQFSKR